MDSQPMRLVARAAAVLRQAHVAARARGCLGGRGCAWLHTGGRLPDRGGSGSRGSGEQRDSRPLRVNEPDTVDEDLRSLESILELLDSPDEARPAKSVDGTPPLRQSRRRHEPAGDDGRGADGPDTTMDDLFSAIDENRRFGGRPQKGGGRRAGSAGDWRKGPDAPDSGGGDTDPMLEFERILADLAKNDTKAYTPDKPAPLFWDEDTIDGEFGSGGRFANKLSPRMLFESGPRASAYSAGRLVGDPDKVSDIAARLRRISRDTNQHDGRSGRGAGYVQGQQRQNRELEQNLLSRLALCRSVPALSSFVFADLISRSATVAKGMAAAQPSSAVYAEVIRKARELQAPSIALYVFNYCCTRMRLADRLRVLNHEVCSELLATAWHGQRDISLVFLVMQNTVATGISSGRGLDRQIDQIAADLRMSYNMPEAASNVLSLKSKIMASVSSGTSIPHSSSQARRGTPPPWP
ncbi:hypothetical protein LPJ61_004488 [Coemansia biformis]|uniref:Mtf2-like C-terminal domain-containing protein n=1 Tax=Coemansia biformis TaxID=1286918 RepID=A0A9W7YA53_9FUNG|nr:hypothetical protein LPJ61_004488 [Coemansia biformis]